MHTVTFFITTARSGTQWVHEALRNLHSDLLVTEHEPIRYSYSPKLCLRNPAALAALRADPIVRRHLAGIHEAIKERDYIEVGFPAFAAAPLLWEEFGERLRLVQLVRHPVRVAASIVTHRWFDPDPLDRADLKENVVLTPDDPGVRLGHYAERWADMSAFEKALFYWTEVHMFGREISEHFLAVPFIRVKFEDLLVRRDTRRKFTQFLNIPYRPEWDDLPRTIVDRYHNQTYKTLDSGNIHRMPETVNLAAEFGYDIDGVGKSELQQRYHLSLMSRVRRGVKSKLRRTIVSGAAVAVGISSGSDVLGYF
jgi:hypothetical protein